MGGCPVRGGQALCSPACPGARARAAASRDGRPCATLSLPCSPRKLWFSLIAKCGASLGWIFGFLLGTWGLFERETQERTT